MLSRHSDWRKELTTLTAKKDTESEYLIKALISTLYKANRIIDSLNENNYDLELGFNNKKSETD